MNVFVEAVAEVAIPVAFLTVMWLLARRGPDPDPAEFGPLGPGE